MDVSRLFDLAAQLNVPGLVVQGAEFLAAVRENAALAQHVMTAGDQAEIDAIHERALAMADGLDADLARVEQR